MARRNGTTWHDDQATKRFIANARRHNKPCMICGQSIDYKTKNYNAPDAPTLDHIRPWRDHPELRSDPGNWQIAHRSCNTAKGVRPRALPEAGNASRDWSKPVSQ